ANAIKFTPRGGKVDLIVDVTDAGEVSFTVRDSGIGIAAEELPHIFDPAWALQARKHSDHKQAGFALGLALCREIVSRHGGELRAASRPGQGATFTVLLPASLDRSLGAEGDAEADRRTRALLLMKKDVVADCAVRALRLEDMDARISSSLQEFFQMMTDWTPTVVVMSSSFAWNMNESTEQRIRAAGVRHILLHSARGGLVELAPPTNTEPVLAMLGRATPSGSTILLVEDDEEYGAVMEFELTQAGYGVLKAYNGVDAVEMAAARRPDGMVLDLALPQLDGFGVLDQLETRGLAVPTVVLTSLEDPGLDTRLADMGALATFRKYELIESHDQSAVARVRDLLGPLLAASASTGHEEGAAGAPGDSA
ncbi:MAG: hybrid sensor histidine kinase/response regulator, partial [Candidatus Binatia bacterium]